MSSSFQDKMSKLKQTVVERTLKNNQNLQMNKQSHTCSNVQIRIDEQPTKISREELCIQQPIIIQKKTSTVSKPSSARKQRDLQSSKVNSSIRNKVTTITKKDVEPFVPIQIPLLEKRIDPKTLNCFTADTTPNNSCKQIQIKIQKDQSKDKQCLKKLFKKIHKLTEELAAAQKQNMQLKVELQNYKNVSRTCGNHQKIINKLEGEKYKLQVDLNLIKKLLQQKDGQIKRLNSFVPKQIIKQVVIQKPVQVQIQVPKYIPGPERIVQKTVQIPKYIQIQKPVHIQQPYEPPREIIKTIEVPTYIQKQRPIYVDKPVYIQVQKRVEVPVQVPVPIQSPPIQVPVYIDRFVNEDYDLKFREYEFQINELAKVNQNLFHENNQLRYQLQMVKANLCLLERHNLQKNRQTQILMHNSFDYYPISPGVDISSGSVKYSISTNPHPRII